MNKEKEKIYKCINYMKKIFFRYCKIILPYLTFFPVDLFFLYNCLN